LKESKNNLVRYRRLTDKELEAVEKDFVKFLSSQGLDAPEWQRVKSEDPAKVDLLLDEFSNLFWESSTERMTYLERKSDADRWVFQFSESSAKVIRWVKKEGSENPDLFSGMKEFPQEARAKEIFLLLEQGLIPCPKERHLELKNLFEKEDLQAL
tara:strand:+ start:265 stop:729 length:465 start_codon:yes stop_codon:yes gene_type:complete